MASNQPQEAHSAATCEVKTERDVNLLTNQPVVRIAARWKGTRPWSRFVVYATENEPADYIEEHAQEIGAKFLEVNGVR